MDFGTLATGAVSLLVPYLAKAGKTIADKIGKDAWDTVNDKIETLYESIKSKFLGNDYASQTLKRLEEKPDDDDRQNAMKGVLRDALAEDGQFQKILAQLLEQIEHEGGDNIIQIYRDSAVATNGSVAANKGGIALGNFSHNNDLHYHYHANGNNKNKNKQQKFIVFSCEHVNTCENFNVPDSCLFSWDKVPGNDNAKLIEFLKERFYLQWIKTAKIEKIDGGRIIKIFYEKNSVLLRLNDEKTEVNLIIDNVETYRFIAKIEAGDLNIYQCKCYYKNEINNNKIAEDIDIVFKGKQDFIIKERQNLIKSIKKAYKFIENKNQNCIFVINPYQRPNEITYFQLGYALGKEMQMIGLFDGNGNSFLPEGILPNKDIANDMDDFIQLMSKKLGEIQPYQPLLTEERGKEASELLGNDRCFYSEST